MDFSLNWVSFYARLSSHYWWKISWKITFWWSQGSGSKNKVPFNDHSNVADFYLWSLLPIDNAKRQNKNTLDEFNRRCLKMLLRVAFLKNFLREMIVLLYRFSKVVGLTCKLDNSIINCRSILVKLFLIFRRTIFGKPVHKIFLS